MKKLVLFLICLFLLGTISLKAQDMTEKEKHSYAVGVIVGEKLKEKITESNINAAIFESLKETIKEKIDFESLKAGFQDIMKGECKITKEEIMAVFEELQKKISEIEQLTDAKKEKTENESQCTINYQRTIAQHFTSISYYYLFIHDFIQSEQSAYKALELDSTYLLPKTNLAHALLFQNRFSEAETICKELSQTIYQDNETYTQALLNDFAELEKAGIISEKHKADVEKIIQMLYIQKLTS
jgi:hypothetical protein